MIRTLASAGYVLGAASVGHLDIGSLLVIVGAAVWAIATWRRNTQDILRRQNADLEDRNKTLEGDCQRLRDDNQRLTALPNVDKLHDLLTRHDREARERDERLISNLAGVATQLGASAALLHSLTVIGGTTVAKGEA